MSSETEKILKPPASVMSSPSGMVEPGQQEKQEKQNSSDIENSVTDSSNTTFSSDITIRVQNLSKCYQIYNVPRDRLKQFVAPRLDHPEHMFHSRPDRGMFAVALLLTARKTVPRLAFVLHAPAYPKLA